MNIDISIIVPCYRVGKAVKADVLPKIQILEGLGCNYEIIMVLDGPDAEAEKSLEQLILENPKLKLIKLARNHGKGFAVRSGMKAAKGRFIGYMDSDNDINPKVLADMYRVIILGEIDAVLPSKRLAESKVTIPSNRKIFSGAYNTYVRKFLGWPISDTQLGAKLYRAELVNSIVELCEINGFVFELEMLAFAQAFGYKRFREIPVSLELHTKSTISLNNSWDIIAETLKFSWDYKFGNRYKKNYENFKTDSKVL